MVRVATNRYQRVHGSKPRGTGQWMFTSNEYGDIDFDDDTTFFQAPGSLPLTKAAQHAKRWAKQHGHYAVYVAEEGVNEDGRETASAAVKRNDKARQRNINKAKRMMKRGFDAEKAAKEHGVRVKDLEESAGGFSKGDIVIALKGPHKGDKHEVIHCFDDGSCNIRPLTHRVKYRMGAAKAQPDEIEMVTNEAKMSAKDKAMARDVHDVDKRDEPMAAGPGAQQKGRRNYLIKKYGKDWRKHAGINESQLNEGVLDDHDDDGFMAKRQLYDLAKYSVQLHKMIQDDDNLEPWVQAKITKAADYIDTVKHYLEYQGVRSAEDAAIDFGMDDIADVDTQIATLEPEVEPELDTDVTTIRPTESVYEEDEEVKESTAPRGPRGTPEEIMARMFAPLKGRKQ